MCRATRLKTSFGFMRSWIVSAARWYSCSETWDLLSPGALIMPQPSLDGSWMKDISDGLHTINTVQCLQLSGQLKPSPSALGSRWYRSGIRRAPGCSRWARVTLSSLTGLSLEFLSINGSGSTHYVSWRLDKICLMSPWTITRQEYPGYRRNSKEK